MRIQRIILRVGDLDRSVEFWAGKVGLDLSARSEGFAFMEGDGAQLALNQIDEMPDDHSLTEIVLETDDVKDVYDQLADRGVPFEVDLRPVTSDGGRELWAAHFRDPDGHLGSLSGWV